MDDPGWRAFFEEYGSLMTQIIHRGKGCYGEVVKRPVHLCSIQIAFEQNRPGSLHHAMLQLKMDMCENYLKE